MKHKKLLLGSILLLGFCLNVYGIWWGLPSRWCVDEPVAAVLKMLAEGSIVPANDYYHPTLHYFFMMIFILPVLMVMKLISYPLNAVAHAASVSWIYLSNTDPNFCNLIYIAARLSSVFAAVAIVYVGWLMAKKCYSEKAGLFTAAFLSVTMGFVSQAHTAKSTMLVVLLVMLSIFFCIKFYGTSGVKKYIVPFFTGGLAIAAKYSGGIILLPLGYYLFELLKGEDKRIKKAAMAFISLAIGILAGFPAIIFKFSEYISAAGYYKARYVPDSAGSSIPLFFSGLLGYLNMVKDILGLPLFILVIMGIIYSILKTRFDLPKRLILLVTVPYYLIFSFNPKLFEIKYIILIVPFLVILASGISENIFKADKIRRGVFLVTAVFVWAGAFLYSLACCDIYARSDIRYAATEWIEKNVPSDERIVILGMPEWVVHNRLFKDRDVTFINNEGRKFDRMYNRRFVRGQQHDITEDELKNLTAQINGGADMVVVYPVFIMQDRLNVAADTVIKESHGIDLAREEVLKEFRVKGRSFFWNPNLGGYEPSKVVIAKNSKKEK